MNNIADIIGSIPEGFKTIKSRRIFKVRKLRNGTNGQIGKYKARLAANSFSQEIGIDYGYDLTFNFLTTRCNALDSERSSIIFCESLRPEQSK